MTGNRKGPSNTGRIDEFSERLGVLNEKTRGLSRALDRKTSSLEKQIKEGFDGLEKQHNNLGDLVADLIKKFDEHKVFTHEERIVECENVNDDYKTNKARAQGWIFAWGVGGISIGAILKAFWDKITGG